MDTSQFVSRSGFQRLPDDKSEQQQSIRWTSKVAQRFTWRPNARLAVPLITACFCLCEFLRGVDAGVLPSILPSVSEEFNASSVEAYWVGSIYLLSTTITEPVFSGVAQAIGRKFCLIISLVIFIVASALCALAPSIRWLIWARMLQGVGAGGMDVSFSMIIVDMVSLKKRAKYDAALQISVAFGLVSGTLIGALLVQKLSWRVIFWANLPAAAIPLVVLAMILHIRQEHKSFIGQIKSMDWIGIFLLSSSLISLLYAIFSGGDVFPWSSPGIVVLLILGPVLLVLFVLHESFVAGNYLRPEPLIPMRLLGNRTAAIGYLIVVVHAIVMSTLAVYYPLYWFIIDGVSLITMGVRMLPTAITPFLCAPLAAQLMIHIQRFKYLNLLGLVFLTGGMAAMCSLTEKSLLGEAIGFQFIYSVGLGVLFPTRSMMVQVAQTNSDDVPMASSLAAMCLNLGQCLGQALGSAVYQNGWDKLVKNAAASGAIPANQIIQAKMVEQSFEKINAFPIPLRDVYHEIGATAISYVWQILVGFCAFTLLASVFVKNMKLDRDTEVKLTFGEDTIDDERKHLIERYSVASEANLAMDRISDTAYQPYRHRTSDSMSATSWERS